MREESVGLVKTKNYTYPEKIELESGKKFGPIDIAYETYGEPNEDKTNTILVCHALSGGPHAAGWHEGDKKPGWWDGMIGPGKTLDTEKYFIICSNILGSCKGTTGPSSINPETGKPYGLDFPLVTVSDMVKVQKKLTDFLDINKLLAVTGGSLGGMQALQWAISFPDSVQFSIPIATSAKSTPQQIAFNEVRRRAVMSDPRWNNGGYYGAEPPKNGLSLARMIGHITFLSDESMRQKFGRNLQDSGDYNFDFDIDFEVESYLHHKGNSFVEQFDANSYLYITRAIDYFDLTKGGEISLKEAFGRVKAKFLVISISSDWLYPPYQSKQIVRALKSDNVDVTYSELKSSYGHDAFLLEFGQLDHIIADFLSQVSVKDVTLDVPSIHTDTPIEKASQIMVKSGFTHLPITSKEGELIGIITAWDIAKSVAEGLGELEDVMTEEVVTASPEEAISNVTRKIKDHNISALPVTGEDGKVLGVVTSDIISHLLGEEKSVSATANSEFKR